MSRAQIHILATQFVRRLLTLCSFVLPLAAASAASDYLWSNVKVGGGGYIPGIEFSPVEKGLAYLRSDMGGIYRWDAKARHWIPLQDSSPEANYRGIESIAPDPVDGATVYAAVGTYRGGPSAILRSSNRGDTWETFPVPFKMGGNEEGRGLGERLAVDPNDTALLYFGSRYDGLQRSTDHGATWSQVTSFPIAGLGVPGQHERPHAGLSFVIFDPTSGSKGTPSSTIIVGVADPGEHHLYRSNDSGRTWSPVSGEPPANLLPAQAQLDRNGVLTIAYSNSMGPYGVSGGAVYKLDIRTNVWTDITPDKSGPKGGYMGLSLDRQHPGTLLVATIDRNDDIIFRTTDGGAHWQDIRALSKRDVSSVPFLYWGRNEASFGWWITGLAIDPFDSNHVGYTTGATVYGTDNLLAAEKNQTVLWKPWVEGVEQTAVITLSSPPKGAPLISGFGDIGSFVHFDLNKSIPMSANPQFTNTNNIDYAEGAPTIIVRSGTHAAHGKVRTATLGYSTDFGKTWKPLYAPLPAGYTEIPPEKMPYNHSDPYTDAAIVTSADGKTFVVMTPEPVLTRDRGKTWLKIRGLPAGGRPVPDRVDPKRFYAADFDSGVIYVSTDGALSFKPQRTTGLPADITADRPHWREIAWPLLTTPNKKDELWFLSQGRLFHSIDGGKNFSAVDTGLTIHAMDFGKAAPGRTNMTLFALAEKDGIGAIWRSTDNGASWLRVNGERSEYGRAFRCLAADKRVFGRVYVGTDGRGIVFGEPSK